MVPRKNKKKHTNNNNNENEVFANIVGDVAKNALIIDLIINLNLGLDILVRHFMILQIEYVSGIICN